jgi:hypothetical protein
LPSIGGHQIQAPSSHEGDDTKRDNEIDGEPSSPTDDAKLDPPPSHLGAKLCQSDRASVHHVGIRAAGGHNPHLHREDREQSNEKPVHD